MALVAGQPVSFRYDLTSSVIPRRRFIQDEARVAAGPIEFDATVDASGPPTREPYQVAMAAHARMETMRASQHASMPAMQQVDADLLSASTQAAAEGRDLDELFEYRLGGVNVSWYWPSPSSWESTLAKTFAKREPFGACTWPAPICGSRSTGTVR
jgi:hypothetical protein